MSFENFPAGETPQQKPSPKKSDYRTILSGGLLVALLGTWGYIIWDK
jgi:nitrate reductase NapE component